MSDPKQPQAPKKPYRTPVIETYGAVRDLTRNLAGNAMNDSMSGSTTKTG